MQFPKWEERRDRAIANQKRAWESSGGFKVLKADELIAQAKASPPSSLDRLDALQRGAWSAEAFITATRELLAGSGLTATVHKQGDSLPQLSSGSGSKYFGAYRELIKDIDQRNDLVVAVVREGERVIGFANAELNTDAPDSMKLLSVDDFSTRSRGVASLVEVGGASFSVGVGHVLVHLLVSALPRAVETDATTLSSQYICRSLGFERTHTRNPCLLRLEK